MQYGFKTTGIFPLGYDNCNMSNLIVSEARNSYVDPCEAIDINNLTNFGTQIFGMLTTLQLVNI